MFRIDGLSLALFKPVGKRRESRSLRFIGQEPRGLPVDWSRAARGCEAPSSVSACCDCGDSPRAVRSACAVMTTWGIGSAIAHVYYERILFLFFKSAAT